MGMVVQPFRDVGQSHLQIVELVQLLSFDRSNSLTTTHARASTGVRGGRSVCVVVAPHNRMPALHSQGCITTTAQADKLNTETGYIMESCAIENHRRQVVHDTVATGYEAWRRLLDMTLTKCFHRLRHDRRENILFDLLHVLPGIVRSDVQQGTAVLLSEAILSTTTKLREDRPHQVMLRRLKLDPGVSSRFKSRCVCGLTDFAADLNPDVETSSSVVDTFGKRSMALSVSALGSRDELSLSLADSRSGFGSTRSSPMPAHVHT
jgi:nuclear pore complex protein Nup205